jgi:hypothetical protein
LNPPARAPRLAPPIAEQKRPEFAHSTEPNRIDFRFKAVDRIRAAGSNASSSNLPPTDITEADAPGAIQLDDLYETGDTVSASTTLRQRSEQVNGVQEPAPLTGLDQFYLEPTSPQATLSVSRYISPLHDDEARPTTGRLPTNSQKTAPLHNPEEERVTADPSTQPVRSLGRMEALLEPETMYFEAAEIVSQSSVETQPVLPDSTSTAEQKNNSSPVDHLTIALLSGPERDVWLSESSSDSTTAPLNSLYDPAAGLAGGPASLTASSFGIVSGATRQSTNSQSTSTAPRPALGEMISRPDDAMTVPNRRAGVPPELGYPQWVGQADANVKLRHRSRGPSQRLVNPTFYGAETDGQ